MPRPFAYVVALLVLILLAVSALVVAPAHAAPQDFTQVAGPTSGGGGDSFVIFYSGDGGWAGLDRSIGDALGKAGAPVIGVDSLRYFMSRRKPEEAAADLAAAIDRYAARFDRPRVVLAGYSFGANALPLLVRQLPPAERAKIKLMVLVSVGDRGELAFHPGDWLNIMSADSEPLRPVLAALKGVPTLCVHGADETQSGCLHMADLLSERVAVPGGHHYAGRYDKVADAIATRVTR